jgi:hypothetical protein
MAFSLIFKTDKKNRGILTIGFFFRILLIAITLIFSAVFILDFLEGRNPIMTLILVLFCLIGSVYRESWIFDPNTKTITYTNGIGPFVKKIKQPFSNIESIQILTISNSKNKFQQIQSQLQTKDGTTIPEIETVKNRFATSFTERTQNIAQILEKQIEYIQL